MAKPEDTFCVMLEKQYDLIVATIDMYLKFPLVFLNRIKSLIKKIENVILTAIEEQLSLVEELVSRLAKMYLEGLDSTYKEFCNTLHTCKAIETMIIEHPTWFGLPPGSDPAAVNAFIDTLCSFKGLQNMIMGFLQSQIDAAMDIINGLMAQMNAQLAIIDELMALYNQQLHKNLVPNPFSKDGAGNNANTSIYDFLGYLDDFAQCFFASCKFATKAKNTAAEYREQLAVDSDNTVKETSALFSDNYAKRKSSVDKSVKRVEAIQRNPGLINKVPAPRTFA